MYKPDIVFYHDKCADGMAALLAFDQAAKEEGHNYAAFPVQYGKPLPVGADRLEGSRVLFVDFFPDVAHFTYMDVCRDVVIVDHHKTSQERAVNLPRFDGSMEDLEDVLMAHSPVCHFDISKSGARLAWELYHGIEEAPPFLIQYIEDRDIWRWTLPDSHAINAWIGSFDISLPVYRALLTDLEDRTPMAVREGSAILRSRDRIVQQIVEGAKLVEMHVSPTTLETVPVLLAWSNVLQSEVGNVLAQQSPSGIAAIAYPTEEVNRLKVSLRSVKPVDLSSILTAWGGGGHAQAGGFVSNDVMVMPEPFRYPHYGS